MTAIAEKEKNAFEYARDARGFVNIGDVLRCRLTKTFDGVGIFANASIEREGVIYSLSGLFKDYFGEENTYVYGKVTNFDSKGKIAFVLCEAPDAMDPITKTQTQPSTQAQFDAELQKAKEAMRAEFELQFKAAELELRHRFVKEEKTKMVEEIAKITGIVSPNASKMLDDLIDVNSLTDIGRALAVVAANFDTSQAFVHQMHHVLRGSL